MPEHFIEDVALVLVVAAVTSMVFRRLGQSTVLAYLFAGLVVGPYIPIPIFADAERIGALSEFGVVLVMFTVGLEFSFRRLWNVLPLAGFVGFVQVSSLAAAGYAVARLAGASAMEGVFLGGGIAISSTMVVAKEYADRPIEPRLRELVFGALVIQDLAAIVIVAALTAVAAGSGLSGGVIASTVGNLVGVLVAIVVVGLLVVPRTIRAIASLGSAEVLMVAVAAVCFGLATLAGSLGYSVALGAFLAGILVAEAGKTHQIETLIHPVRDLFAALFFVSVGMSVDPRVAVQYLGLSLAVAATVVVGQFVVVTVAGTLSGNGVRRSVLAGLSLGQIGEFAFIIAAIGGDAGVVGEFLAPVMVTVAVLTAFTTSASLRFSDRIAQTVEHALPRRLQMFASLCESWFEALRRAEAPRKGRSHLRTAAVVIVIDAVAILAVWLAASIWGGDLGAWLHAKVGIPPEWGPSAAGVGAAVVTVPPVVGLVRSARRAGQLLAERVIPLRRDGKADLGAAPRRAFVVTLQFLVVVGVGGPIVMLLTPVVDTPWVAVGIGSLLVGLSVYLWRSALDLQGHVRAGAAALAELIEAQMADDEPAAAPLPDLLPGLGTPIGVVLASDAFACGQTLAELDLRAKTGATVLAVKREEGTVSMPSGSERLGAGDTVVLAGSDHAVEAARTVLTAIDPPG